MGFDILPGPHPILPVRRNNRYFNSSTDKPKPFLWHTLRMLIYTFTQQAARFSHADLTPFQHPVEAPQGTSLYPRITWIGHASFLVEFEGVTFLTDPIFGNASPLFPRIQPPGLTPERLPTIDAVLISHNHRDHLDTRSLLYLRDRFQPYLLVPKGDGKWFKSRGFAHVEECTWWQKITFTRNGKEATCVFLPTYHWSQRGLLDRNRSLWGSWLMQAEAGQVYFGGDTAYAEHFSMINAIYPSIDVALLPIGPCEPHEWIRHAHMSAEEAGQAFIELGATCLIPMHWGTFRFGTDKPSAPAERLLTWWRQNHDITQHLELRMPPFGMPVSLDQQYPASKPYSDTLSLNQQ